MNSTPLARSRPFSPVLAGGVVILSLTLLPFQILMAQDPCVAPFGAQEGLGAQHSIPPCPTSPDSRPWPNSVAHAVDLSVNTGLGALTAGIRAVFAHRPFWPAFKNGALGGAIHYAGKRIIGTQEPALRLLGRQVAALGASAIRNSGDGRAPFASAVFPLGPTRLYVGERRVRVKLDLAGSVALIYVATRPHAQLNTGASLTAGTPIFNNVSVSARGHQASQTAGVVGLVGPGTPREPVAHELIHAAQYDFAFIAWAEPAERALVPSLPAGDFLSKNVDLGLSMVLWGAGHWLVPIDQQPWEREAILMTTRPWP